MNNSSSFLSTKPWLPLNTLLHKLHKHGQTCFVRSSRRGNLDNHYADSTDNDIVVMFWNLGVNVNNDDNDDGDDNDEDDDNDDYNDDFGKYSNNDNNDHGHYHNVTDTVLIMSQYIFFVGSRWHGSDFVEKTSTVIAQWWRRKNKTQKQTRFFLYTIWARKLKVSSAMAITYSWNYNIFDWWYMYYYSTKPIIWNELWSVCGWWYSPSSGPPFSEVD